MSIPELVGLSAMRERADEASRLLKTLANAQRLRMLCLLVGKEMTVGQLNEELADLSQSALSQHLARLREEGLVSTRREAQTIWYRVVEGPTETLITALHGIYCEPNRGGPRSGARSRNRRR